ncbi:MAG: aldehyde dehydrogenase family protein [Akkermansiaceae bacterium]
MLKITKTPKCYVGGAFIRSESGRVAPQNDASGIFFANIPLCTRKDLRNAVEAAAKAGPGWAARNAYNRGQILYRIAEMLDARAAEMSEAISLGGTSKKNSEREVRASIERIVHYAGWTDKFQALLGSVNPVSSPHFNFTVTEPMGIIGVVAPDEMPLLGLLSLVLPAITSGNTVVALASTTLPYPSILLGEMLATSDLPGGVVNLLTGQRGDLVPTFATHAHLRGIAAVASLEDRITLQIGAADSVKRLKLIPAEAATDWYSDNAQGLYEIRDHLEAKTTWHPIGA